MPPKFKTVVADPPWAYSGDVVRACKNNPAHLGVGVAERYPTLSIDQLVGMNVKDFVEDNAYLFLWITNGFLVDPAHPAYTICKAWGFRPVTVLTWVKHKKGEPDEPSRKTGAYFRGASEHAVFAVRGSLPMSASPATWFGTERTRHSEKPDAFYKLVEDVAPGPYLDIFARSERPGWTTWGNEVNDPSAPNIIVPGTETRPLVDTDSATLRALIDDSNTPAGRRMAARKILDAR